MSKSKNLLQVLAILHEHALNERGIAMATKQLPKPQPDDLACKTKNSSNADASLNPVLGIYRMNRFRHFTPKLVLVILKPLLIDLLAKKI